MKTKPTIAPLTRSLRACAARKVKRSAGTRATKARLRSSVDASSCVEASLIAR